VHQLVNINIYIKIHGATIKKHTQNMYTFYVFHGDDSYANASWCHVMRTMPVTSKFYITSVATVRTELGTVLNIGLVHSGGLMVSLLIFC